MNQAEANSYAQQLVSLWLRGGRRAGTDLMVRIVAGTESDPNIAEAACKHLIAHLFGRAALADMRSDRLVLTGIEIEQWRVTAPAPGQQATRIDFYGRFTMNARERTELHYIATVTGASLTGNVRSVERQLELDVLLLDWRAVQSNGFWYFRGPELPTLGHVWNRQTQRPVNMPAAQRAPASSQPAPR